MITNVPNFRNKKIRKLLTCEPVISRLFAKINLAECLSYSPNNPRLLLFVECFFYPQRPEYFKSRQFYEQHKVKLKLSNLDKYASKINKEAGCELIKKVSFRQLKKQTNGFEDKPTKEAYYFVDWNAPLFEPIKPHLFEPFNQQSKLEVLKNNVFWRLYTFLPFVPEPDLEDLYSESELEDELNDYIEAKRALENSGISSIKDLKAKLKIKLSRIDTAFSFFYNFPDYYRLAYSKDTINKLLSLELKGVPLMLHHKGEYHALIKNLELQRAEFLNIFKPEQTSDLDLSNIELLKKKYLAKIRAKRKKIFEDMASLLKELKSKERD